MSTESHGIATDASAPLWSRLKHAHHFRSKEEEFDACKIGMWLFLTTEVLLFSGLFCAYAIFRAMYPEAFRGGSHHLDWLWGSINTGVLLISSFTIAWSIRCAQMNQQALLKFNLAFTAFCGLLFTGIKFGLEYGPKWAAGKRPGSLYDYPNPSTPNEPVWWSVYYAATGTHLLHVLIGTAVILIMLARAQKGMYGPKHYTGIEIAGLYWHLVDLIWIFLFPLLYLIH
ncbi:MAG: cytochrome c oxidase subunit 3 family protein [Phycisphaeraceae bacterium]|nr:cytochrome c oxidase subunit 3 family protein [Phycisphaeraceae bacterium]